jgi:hypothetical protein
MTSSELERAETRMRQKWYDLIMAEQQGASMQALERMYNIYMLAVEEYNHCSRQLQSEPPFPVSEQRSVNHPPATTQGIRHKKKAS